MLGNEHKKERVSERLQNLNNQPRHRGYLPGCHARAADADNRVAYSVKTLQGNWAEERRDAAFSEDKPVIPTELENAWQTTYSTMVKNVAQNSQFRPEKDINQQELVNIIDGHNQRYPGHQPMHDPHYKETVATAFLTTTRSTFVAPKDVQKAAKEYVPPVLGGSPDAQPRAVILRLRHRLLHMNGGTFAGLRRSLRAMDTTGDFRLSHQELKEGLARYNIPLSDAEIKVLIRFFDKEGSDDVDITEFIRGLRGSMSDRRAALVKKAYAMLNSIRDGVVRLADVMQLYDTAQHPDVRSGKIDYDEAFRQFAVQWDGNAEDVIEFADFKDYYEGVSAAINNDQAFEVMVRNTWHISGGEGLCKNTSCRRVIVTHTNGRQTSEEIKNDLGIGPKDIEKMKQNLISQGITDISRIDIK